MKNFVVTSFGIMLAVVAASPSCWAADVNFLAGDGNFNTAASWSDGMLPSLDIDNHFIQDGLTATYSAGTVSVRKLVVSDGSPGTLNMTGGDLTAAGGDDSFQIGRGCCGGDGLVDLSGTAILRTTGQSGVGERDKGVLHIGPDASVISPGVYWRVGNFGPSVDAGLEGNGLLDIEGTFSARALFIGVQDGTGVVRVRGTGSVTLTQQDDNPGFADIDMDFNHNPIFHPNQSGTIHMEGSNASMSARNLFSQHDALSPVKNLLWFTADLGGVSPITLTNAVNINNNKLQVDLNGFDVAPLATLLLIDAAPGGIAPGTSFAELEVLGGASAPNYYVVYDGPNGDILLARTIPEPSTMLLIGLGMSLAFCAKRRASR